MKVVILGVILLFCARGSVAAELTAVERGLCREDIAMLGETVPALLNRSKNVGLVRVVGVRSAKDDVWLGDDVVFELEVLSELKNQVRKQRIFLPGVRAPSGAQAGYRDAIERHNSLGEFGYRMFGGTTQLYRRQDSRCEYVPALVMGQTYLAILPGPFSPKSFEPIGDARTDGWFKSVVREIAHQQSMVGEGVDPLQPGR